MPDPSELSLIEHVRFRSGMYVGSPDFFGLIHYLVSGVSLLLDHCPTWLEIKLDEQGVSLAADVDLHLSMRGSLVSPFEIIDQPSHKAVDGAIVAALSQGLVVDAVSGGERWNIRFRAGVRNELKRENSSAQAETHLLAQPDPSIFSVTSISSYNFHSYLRRLSFLYPRTTFRLLSDGIRTEYQSPHGLRDLFHCITAPYQILHEPIHFQVSEIDLSIELVFALHSWSNDVIISFINNGRAAEGGSHEEGLRKMLLQFRKLAGIAKGNTPYGKGNGIVALMSVKCPELTWRGCIKGEINMPALAVRIEEVLSERTQEWIQDDPERVAQLQDCRVFHFPESWSPQF